MQRAKRAIEAREDLADTVEDIEYFRKHEVERGISKI
jgi:hypothetical protein